MTQSSADSNQVVADSDNHQTLVIILVGYPGSGKTTYALTKYPEAKIISGDYFNQAHQRKTRSLDQVVNELEFALKLRSHAIIVIDRTNLTIDARHKLITLAQKYQAIPVCHVSTVSLEESYQRNVLRSHDGERVPKIAYYSMRKTYVYPDQIEGCLVQTFS